MKMMLLLTLLLSNLAQARDPFSPPGAGCVAEDAPAAGWRLLGVLGQADTLVSRWLSPAGRGVSLADNATPGGGEHWQVQRNALDGVTLSLNAACRPVRYHYPLKRGNFHAQAVTARPAVAGPDWPRGGTDHLPDLQ